MAGSNTALTHVALTCKYCNTKWSTSMESWTPYGDPVYVCCPKCPVMVKIRIPFPGEDIKQQETIADRRALEFGDL